MKRFKILAIIAAVIGLAFLTSCEVGLGSMLNLVGPVVNVSSPIPVGEQTDIAVNDVFNMSGTVSSETRIALLEIKLTSLYNDQIREEGREWLWEGQWYFREDSDKSWKLYEESDYINFINVDSDTEINPPSWRVTGGVVDWDLPILMEGLRAPADYYFTVSATDSTGRRDSNSIFKLKVSYDNDTPNIEFRVPRLLLGRETGTGQGGTLWSRMYPDYPYNEQDGYIFDTYIFDPVNNPEGTFNFINNWVTAPQELRWEIEKDMIGEFFLTFEFTNRHNLNTGDGKQLYFRYQWGENDIGLPFLPKRGIFTDDHFGYPLQFTWIREALGEDEIVQRDPFTGDPIGGYLPVGGLDLTDIKGKYTPIQIVSRLVDGAGNVAYRSNGWFAYLPDADKPWARINFGTKYDHEDVEAGIVPNNAPNFKYLWSNQPIADSDNFAYHREGVESLRWELFKLKDDTLEVDETVLPFKEENIQFINTDSLTRRRWSFTPRPEFGAGRFKIIVYVTDIHGRESDPQIAFFTIDDNTTPRVKEIESPSDTESLFGDSNGTFNITGIAHIANPRSVHQVDIVWIKPDDNPATVLSRKLKYLDKNYANWDITDHEDAESKVWNVNPGSITYVTTNDDMREYRFTHSLNLFNDLNTGIGPGKNPHSRQEFLVRVSFVPVAGRIQSSVFEFHTEGDSSAPVLEIDKITVTSDSEQKVYDNDGGFGLLSFIGEGYKIKVEGTWKDDSFEKWTGLSVDERLGFLTNFGVTWTGQGQEIINLGGSISSNGRWESDEYTFTGDNTDAFITITASLTDLSGNIGRGNETMIIETTQPTLIRISSETSDGSYGEYKATNINDPGSRYIDIFLEFNKEVMFFENPLTPPFIPDGIAPHLLLNNGGHAFYYSGNAVSSRLVFRYFVDGLVPDPALIPQAIPGFGGGSIPRLNVDEIIWNDYSPEDLVSVDGSTVAVIHEDVFNPERAVSLAGGKNIVIDKVRPTVQSIVTGASDTRHLGRNFPITITVNFSKPVIILGATTGTRESPGNFYLNLRGGNLLPRGARALYDSAGSSSVSFLYTVEDGDDTSAFSGDNRFLAVASIFADLSINDHAGNALATPITLPNNGNLNRQIIINTILPAPPAIQGIDTELNNYVGRSFRITGIQGQNFPVEYNLNYNPSDPETGWLEAPVAGRTGSGSNWQTADIPITMNGTFNITARQYDNTVPPNISATSTTPLQITINNAPLLTRLSSPTPDGIYAFRENPSQTILIDLHFRIPVNINTTGGSPYLELNVAGHTGTANRALLQAGQTGSENVWTFVYSIPTPLVFVERLNVNSFVTGGAVFTDSDGVNLNNHITDLNMIVPSNRFSAQKNIEIMAGHPAAINNGIVFSGGNQLSITFNRDIYPGDTDTPLVFTQVAAGYRIPAVMSVSRWDELFNNRTDIWQGVTVPASFGTTNETKAAAWEALGNHLYQRGSNGATLDPGNPTNLISSTAVQYVLMYDVDTNAPDASIVGLPTGVTMQHVRDIMRSAEALRFNAMDREVSIINDGQGRPRILRIALTGTKALPVRGASYQWNFPNGFVKDVLNNPNGESNTGFDSSLSSSISAQDFPGNEPPVIRIDKGSDIETIIGTGENRQAEQPLTTRVRIDGRTPGTTFQYRTRQTTDNVGRLLWRNGQNLSGVNYSENDIQTPALDTGTAFGPFNNGAILIVNNARRNGIAPWGLPNVGSQHQNDFASFDAARNRPQSGNSVTPHPAPGLNHWVPMQAWGNTWTDYNTTGPFTIGTTNDIANYNDGGMIIHINARLVQNNAMQAYEAAYRSVFVFNNTTINNNGALLGRNATGGAPTANTYLLNLGFDGGSETNTAILPYPQFGRMWIRGGDTIGGDSSIPDFPIARDRTLARKARLMTPIAANAKFNNAANAQNAIVQNGFTGAGGDIPATYRGRENNAVVGGTPTSNDLANPVPAAQYPGEYLWFWVTWRINVNAYIDPFAGELPASEFPFPQTPQNYKELYKGIVPFKEHYPLIPGRTTVFETRRVYRVRYGGQGGQLDFGPLSPSPTARDLP
jgi:hypothetical protein